MKSFTTKHMMLFMLSVICMSAHHTSAQENSPESNIREAVKNQNIEAVQNLLDQGVDPNTQGDMGKTPLFIAAENAQDKIAKALINAGANVHKKAFSKTVSPFGIAVFNQNTDIMKMLYNAGARINEGGMPDPNQMMYFGATYIPIHEAAAQGKEESVKTLILLGVDPNIRDASGRTPLHRATESKNPNIISTLGSLEADPHLQNQESQTPLQAALWAKAGAKVVKALLHIGADPNKPSKTHNETLTPLEITIRNANPEAAEVLIKNGATVHENFLKRAKKELKSYPSYNQQDKQKIVNLITNALQEREFDKARAQYQRTDSPDVGKLPPEVTEKIMQYNR